MARSVIYKLTCVLVACMLVLTAPYAEAMKCDSVYIKLTPCLGYIRGTGGSVPFLCCLGIKSLKSAAKSRQDRQTACQCLTQAAKGVNGLNIKLIESIPSKCRVHIPFTLSPYTDCSKVSSLDWA
ncbi:Non-specific lipid-transfer protein [Thalictrum thalictroides]|uniref:Non-specific lipid-transfer protein n=1 Tax=Thalictrum thalictroides TaxID=46969 RepID=A0A7J6WXM5_THATH|nr:Non-specific lipid-transfer protein [Thalictrum thalictroides]